MLDRLSILERENAELRERVAYLESCLLGGPVSYAVLGLTGQEERVFAALMNRDQLSKEQLLTIAYADRLDADLPDLKIIDVFVCKIRKKLKPLDLDIETIWGRGYAITPRMKECVRALIAQVGGDRSARAA